MAIYSDEKRPVLAIWIKYTLLINVIFFIILILFWILLAGLSAAITRTGTYATILIAVNVFSFLLYEQLFRPDDDSWRRLAEILGTLQVLCSLLSLLIILGTIALALSPGLASIILPVQSGSQPPAVVTTPVAVILPTTVQVEVTTTECYKTETGCLPIMPSPTVPPTGTKIAESDPVIGSYTFDIPQFDTKKPKEVLYYSRAGNSEYNYQSVPLDYSPDIKWTFRDDGVILFSDNLTGNLLRLGTWTKAESAPGITEYQIRRGNHDYRGSFLNGAFRITSPNVWTMTKVS
jgi:hypothetical protein